jgi:hypothetical protein
LYLAVSLENSGWSESLLDISWFGRVAISFCGRLKSFDSGSFIEVGILGDPIEVVLVSDIINNKYNA